MDITSNLVQDISDMFADSLKIDQSIYDSVLEYSDDSLKLFSDINLSISNLFPVLNDISEFISDSNLNDVQVSLSTIDNLKSLEEFVDTYKLSSIDISDYTKDIISSLDELYLSLNENISIDELIKSLSDSLIELSDTFIPHFLSLEEILNENISIIVDEKLNSFISHLETLGKEISSSFDKDIISNVKNSIEKLKTAFNDDSNFNDNLLSNSITMFDSVKLELDYIVDSIISNIDIISNSKFDMTQFFQSFMPDNLIDDINSLKTSLSNISLYDKLTKQLNDVSTLLSSFGDNIEIDNIMSNFDSIAISLSDMSESINHSMNSFISSFNDDFSNLIDVSSVEVKFNNIIEHFKQELSELNGIDIKLTDIISIGDIESTIVLFTDTIQRQLKINTNGILNDYVENLTNSINSITNNKLNNLTIPDIETKFNFNDLKVYIDDTFSNKVIEELSGINSLLKKISDDNNKNHKEIKQLNKVKTQTTYQRFFV